MRDLGLQVLLNLYNLGIERSRDAYHEQRLHENGTCIDCQAVQSGVAMRCHGCREKREALQAAVRKQRQRKAT